ncbi:MAG: ornithine cyclodeaminase family protein [Kordiimonadaceae bacterium]|jgi:alanine dehydrogenase|nr:ornithine cyclodeaminase family protein [Kordiimonadaceae bacterium]MBT6329057.1 ornithine cyclodeaminase family protein [Kordiimonadaceae bacterium]MBT7581947.1 ornithine cyclodeaminase family protein [Kordiimonadaceae bacterium]
MKYLSKELLETLLPYPELIDALNEGFRRGGNTPLRHVHKVGKNSLLLMPSWQQGGMMGLKMTMVCPDNGKQGLDTIQSTYILSDATTGVPKAILDGDELTFRRTACASALASSYLSTRQAKSMLMMGTGKLAPHLIRAHSSVRDLKEIYIWGRRFEQAEKLAKALNNELTATVTAIKDPSKYANICDIISCATFANEPILKGKWLNSDKPQHIDLVGGYTYDMREADNDVIACSNIYVDAFSGALSEAGDILRPIDEGIISKDDVLGDLFDLVSDNFKRQANGKNSFFKSVGTALEDLIAAKLGFDNYRNN